MIDDTLLHCFNLREAYRFGILEYDQYRELMANVAMGRMAGLSGGICGRDADYVGDRSDLGVRVAVVTGGDDD